MWVKLVRIKSGFGSGIEITLPDPKLYPNLIMLLKFERITFMQRVYKKFKIIQEN
jgi:hypothetical protein